MQIQNETFHMRINASDRAILEELAARLHRSQSDAVRIAVIALFNAMKAEAGETLTPAAEAEFARLIIKYRNTGEK